MNVMDLLETIIQNRSFVNLNQCIYLHKIMILDIV